MLADIIPLVLVVPTCGPDGERKERTHAGRAVSPFAVEDAFLRGDAAEVVDTWAEGGLEDAAFARVGEGAEAGPGGLGRGHRVRVHDAANRVCRGGVPCSPSLGMGGRGVVWGWLGPAQKCFTSGHFPSFPHMDPSKLNRVYLTAGSGSIRVLFDS